MITFTLKENKGKNSADIIMSGDIILDEIENVHKKLMEASDKYAKIELLVNNVTQIDMSGIQFLIAFRKKMKNKNKTEYINLKLDIEDEKVMIRAGFSYLLGKKKN